MTGHQWINVAQIEEFALRDRKVVNAGDRPVLVLRYGEDFYAVDNRCPHMGFPLDKGSVKDCILTCLWHTAQFDLRTGGTFSQFADDVRCYPIQQRDGALWIDTAPRTDERAHQRKRLNDGLERNIRLVVAKAVLALLESGDVRDVFLSGLTFGTRNRAAGWGQGLTMLTCFMNILPALDRPDQARALYHGLDAVSVEVAGMAPRYPIDPLPGRTADLPTLKRWFRQFIEVRDDEGAERCVVSAIAGGATSAEMTDLLFSAITDHRYIQLGHPADFANKALEALDIVGWEHAAPILGSLVGGIARASRMEEASSWRHPIDLVAMLDAAFRELPSAVVAAGTSGASTRPAWNDRRLLVDQILSDDPHATIEALLAALRAGATAEQVAGTVAYAAALRMARFHTANEFGDWDVVLHTFTFANALHQAIRRLVAAEVDRATPDVGREERAVPLLRGVFDAAMSIYLDRFFNMPAARLPQLTANGTPVDDLLTDFLALLDRQQQVAPAAEAVAHYLSAGSDPARLLAVFGKALLREDRDFHTIQTVEAAFRQYRLLRDTPEATHVLIAAARYLAAHTPTMREQGQTFQIAERLHRGEKLYEE